MTFTRAFVMGSPSTGGRSRIAKSHDMTEPLKGSVFATVTPSTPGSASSRVRSSARWVATFSSPGYRSPGSPTRKVNAPVASIPGSVRVIATRLLVVSPARITTTTLSATSTATRPRRSALRRREPTFRASLDAMDRRVRAPASSAGTVPKATAVTTESPIVKSTTEVSSSAAASRGSRSTSACTSVRRAIAAIPRPTTDAINATTTLSVMS